MGPSVSCSVCATCHELWPRVTDWLIIPMSPPQTKQPPHWADHGYHGVVAVLRLLLAVEWRWWPHSCAHTVPLSGTPQVGHSELGAGIYHHISSLSWAGHMAYFDTCPQGIFSNYWEFWGRGCPSPLGVRTVTANKYLSRSCNYNFKQDTKFCFQHWTRRSKTASDKYNILCMQETHWVQWVPDRFKQWRRPPPPPSSQ